MHPMQQDSKDLAKVIIDSNFELFVVVESFNDFVDEDDKGVETIEDCAP